MRPELRVISVLLLTGVRFPLQPQSAGAETTPSIRGAARDKDVIGGSVWAGFTHVVRSPYLFNVGIFLLLFSITSTFLYFQQAAIVSGAFKDRAAPA